jgi:hypothetical protein
MRKKVVLGFAGMLMSMLAGCGSDDGRSVADSTGAGDDSTVGRNPGGAATGAMRPKS